MTIAAIDNYKSAEKKKITCVVVDTNIIMDDNEIMYKLMKEYDKIIFPLTTIKELDKHKFDKDKSYSARCAIRSIREFQLKFPDIIQFSANDDEISANDEKIIEVAKQNNAILATKDISMGLIANTKGVETKIYDTMMNDIFDPYYYINDTDLYKATNEDIFSFAQMYDDGDYETLLKIFSDITKRTIIKNSWIFIFINVVGKSPIIYANNPIKKIIERIDNVPKYRKINIDIHTNINALDEYQNCCIYAMLEAPNLLLCGSYGSGKSLLTTAFALANNERKTYITRPNIGVDRRLELGFLPGHLDEKLFQWQTGIMSSLYYIYSDTKGQMSTKMQGGSTYDFVKDAIFKKYFEMMSLETIQGVSFLKSDLVLLDEVQLCSISILSIILSRFGNGAKLIMTGDPKQAYEAIRPAESGLLKTLRILPHRSLAYVELKYNYRSDLIEIANMLQNKVIE